MIEIETIDWNDLTDLALLDQAGYIPIPGESGEQFKQRVLKSHAAMQDLCNKVANGEKVMFCDTEISQAAAVPAEVLTECAKISEELYNFNIDWVPGFYLSKDIGPLWGGCSISDHQTYESVYFVRAAFKEKQRYFIYERDELIAHELCHVARQYMNDNAIEEYFAYQTSPSAFRRYIGNCFVHSYEAVVFIIASMLPMAGELISIFLENPLPIWPFWLVAATLIISVLAKNHLIWSNMKKAEKKLKSFGFTTAKPILFRMTYREIKQLCKFKKSAQFSEFVSQKCNANDLRWQLINHRFIAPETETAQQ